MTARTIIAKGHCRATCGYAGISAAPCEHECVAPEFNLIHGGHYSASDAIIAALSAQGYPRIRDRSGKRAGTDRMYRWNINGVDADASAKVRWQKALTPVSRSGGE